MASEDELDDIFTDDIFADDDSDWEKDQEKNDHGIISQSGKSLDKCISEMEQLQRLAYKEREAMEVDNNKYYSLGTHSDISTDLLTSKWLDSGAEMLHSRTLLGILSEETIAQQKKISRQIKTIRNLQWLLDPMKHALVASIALRGRDTIEEQGGRGAYRRAILGALLIRLQQDHEQNFPHGPQQILQQRMIKESSAKLDRHNQNDIEAKQENSSFAQTISVWNPDFRRFISLRVLFSPNRDSCILNIEALKNIGSDMTDTREPNTHEQSFAYNPLRIIDLKLVVSRCGCLVDFPGVHVLPNSILREMDESCVPDMVIGGAFPELQRLRTGHTIQDEMLIFSEISFWTFFSV